MKEQLILHLNHQKFPCIMAKALLKKGQMEVYEAHDLDYECEQILSVFYQFIEQYRQNRDSLHSFIIIVKNQASFDEFEESFWSFLRKVIRMDRMHFKHAENVSPNPYDPHFSFSIGEEAFFILALHPESPRFARRFSYPAIVFNPHQQFEDLRTKGVYERVKRIIRLKDFELQQGPNPMLSDFGEASEVYQYTGKVYKMSDKLPEKLKELG